MRFRFTLQYLSEIVEISEPDGWLGATLKLGRDKDFHSLVEFFEGSFIFYGSNGQVNGGIDKIKEWEQDGGPDATILFFADFTQNEENFYEIFAGQLDISLSEELPDRKFRIPIIRDDFWAKFYNRKDTQVDLQSLFDLDGASITHVEPVNVHFIPQLIQQNYLGQGEQGEPWFPCQVLVTSARWDFDTGFDYGIIDFENEILDEIEEKFHYPMVESPTVPFEMFLMKYAGEYTFEIFLSLWGNSEFSSPAAGVDVYFKINNIGTPITLTRTDFPTVLDGGGCPIDGRSTFEYTGTHTLAKGDRVYLYIKTDGVYFGGYSVFMPNYAIFPSYMRVTGQTEFAETSGNGFLVHDSAAAIIKGHGLGVDNPFYSEFFGGILTTARQYENDGCAWKHAHFKGLHIRGYTLAEKPYSMSFMQWWKGVYPIFNLCLFYDYIQGPGTEGWTPSPLPPLPSWGVYGTSSEPIVTSVGLASPIFTVSNGVSVGGVSDILHPLGMTFDAGHTYKYHYDWTTQTDYFTFESIEIHMQLLTVGLVVLDELVLSAAPAAGFDNSEVGDWEFVAPVGMTQMGMLIKYPSGSHDTGLVTLNSFTDETESIPDGEGTLIPVIRVEQIEAVHDPIPVVNISNIRQITRKYDTDKIYNKIEIGYSEWKADAVAGLNDPQTKRTYATRFQKIGQSIQIFSEWIAASTAFEETRRTAVEKSKDNKFDDKTFILRLFGEGSPDGFNPEFDEGFSLVTNLQNPSRKYNIALSAGRNFLRFRNWFNGCLQSYLTSFYKWVDGEGNNDMVSTMDNSPDCMNEDFDGQPFAENANIPVTEDIIHTTYHYDIECPLALVDYLKIRNNRKKAIGISQTDSNHVPLFIEELGYEIMKGTIKLSGWTTQYLDLTVVEGIAPTQECFPSTECDNPITDEFDEILTDENGVCITA